MFDPAPWINGSGFVVIGAGLRLGYKHIQAAIERGRLRDDALGKRLVRYEEKNAEGHDGILKQVHEAHQHLLEHFQARHEEVIDRLSHVEALVNGKNHPKRRGPNGA